MRQGIAPYGFCDRTGFRYDLVDLVDEWVNGIPTGRRVGKDMEDPDHPQLRLDELPPLDDPRALENPRPDQSLGESRRLSSWNPIGLNIFALKGETGRVTVTTS